MSIGYFLFLNFIMSLACNLAHPITPTFFTEIGMPDYMFGVAFSVMAATNFLFCQFWGKLSDSIGRIRVISITIICYGIGQLFFMLSNSIIEIILSRLIAGAFAGGYLVASIAYIVDVTNQSNRAKYMTHYTAYTSLSAAAGYLIGGLVGDVSIQFSFILQIILCIAIGIVFYKTFHHTEIDRQILGGQIQESIKLVNPLTAFQEAKGIVNMALAVFFITTFLTAFATYGYDTSFNYYIKDILGFPSSYNGIIKATTGLIGLVANFTINQWIVKHMNIRKAIVVMLAICGIFLFIGAAVQGVITFILVNIVFYCFNTMYLPIQQVMVTMGQSETTNGRLFGIYNSMKTIGMITGPIFAGYVYTINSKLPFIFGGIAFILAAVICIVNYYQYNSTHYSE